MLEVDILRMNQAQLARTAKFLGLSAPGKRGIWVLRKSCSDPRTHVEKPLKFSTRTPDLKTAILRASARWEAHVERVHGAQHLPTLARSNGWASLKLIGEHYQRAAICAPGVRKHNWSRFRRIIRDVFLDHDFDTLNADILDGRVVRLWQLAQKERAERDHLPHAPAECERAKRGANAIYRQGRSVFSAAMLRSYADAGLRLPSSAAEFPRQGFLDAQPAPDAELLPEAVEAKIWRGVRLLRKFQPGVYAAVILMFRAGVRNSEATKSRWNWLQNIRGGGTVLALTTQGDFKTKTGRPRAPRIGDDVIAALASVRQPRDAFLKDPELPKLIAQGITHEQALDQLFATQHLVPGKTDHDRHENCNRRLNQFLRACGVQSVKGKIGYRLRAHAIGVTWDAFGPAAAQQLAGHTTIKTTELYHRPRAEYAPLAIPV